MKRGAPQHQHIGFRKLYRQTKDSMRMRTLHIGMVHFHHRPELLQEQYTEFPLRNFSNSTTFQKRHPCLSPAHLNCRMLKDVRSFHIDTFSKHFPLTSILYALVRRKAGIHYHELFHHLTLAEIRNAVLLVLV